MKIRVCRSEYDVTSGKITKKTRTDKPVTISIKYKTAKESEVVIRVGHLGDKDASIEIKEGIREILFES